MPRFYLVKGKPGMPVANPHDPRVFLGRAGGKLDGEPIEQVVAHHFDLLKPLNKGLLELLAGPIDAKDHDDARAQLLGRAAPKATTHSAKGGDK